MKKLHPADKRNTIPLYNEEILKYGERYGHGTRLGDYDVSTREVGALCGSRIIIDIRWDKNSQKTSAPRRIRDIGYHVDACALGTAAAAIFATAAIGADKTQLQNIRNQLKNMLKGDAFCFKEETPWRALELLQAARYYPSRHAAILLPAEALLRAFNETESKLRQKTAQ